MSSSIALKAVVSKPTLKVHLADVRSGNFDRIAIESPKLAAVSRITSEEAHSKGLDEFVDIVRDKFGKSTNQFLYLLETRLGAEIRNGTFDDPKVREMFLGLIQKNSDAIDTLPKVVGNLVRSGVPISCLGRVASKAIRRSNTLCPIDVCQTLASDLRTGEYSDVLPPDLVKQISNSLLDGISPKVSPQLTDPVASSSTSTPFSVPNSEPIIRLVYSQDLVPANSAPAGEPVVRLVSSSNLASTHISAPKTTSIPVDSAPLTHLRLSVPTQSDPHLSPVLVRQISKSEILSNGPKKSDSLLVLQKPDLSAVIDRARTSVSSPPLKLVHSVSVSSASSSKIVSPHRFPLPKASYLASPKPSPELVTSKPPASSLLRSSSSAVDRSKTIVRKSFSVIAPSLVSGASSLKRRTISSQLSVAKKSPSASKKLKTTIPLSETLINKKTLKKTKIKSISSKINSKLKQLPPKAKIASTKNPRAKPSSSSKINPLIKSPKNKPKKPQMKVLIPSPKAAPTKIKAPQKGKKLQKGPAKKSKMPIQKRSDSKDKTQRRKKAKRKIVIALLTSKKKTRKKLKMRN